MVRCYVKAGLTDRPGLGLIRGSRTEGFLYPRHCEEQSDEAHQSFCKDKAPHRGQVAQLVEQRTENPRVGGSIPPLATILFNDLRQPTQLPFFVVCNSSVVEKGFELVYSLELSYVAESSAAFRISCTSEVALLESH